MFDENGNGAMAMVNHLMNVKDSRWLQVEVCREFQRGQCSREFNECKFAHPPAHVEVQNGRVTACYDSIKKGRCNRENPKCKYLHPPQHIKDQLLINGRNNLALKNLIMNQLTNGYTPGAIPGQPGIAHAAALQQHPAFMAQLAVQGGGQPGMGGLGQLAGYPGYYAAISPGALYSPAQPASIPASSAASQHTPDSAQPQTDLSVTLGSMASSPLHQQPKPRTDRVEVCREFLRGSCQRAEGECKFAHPGAEVERGTDGSVRVCLEFVRAGGAAGACAGLCRLFHPPPHLLLALFTASLAANAGTAAFPDPSLSPPLSATAFSQNTASFASALAAHANSSAATMVTSSVAPQPSTGHSPASGIGKKRRLDDLEPQPQLQPQLQLQPQPQHQQQQHQQQQQLQAQLFQQQLLQQQLLLLQQQQQQPQPQMEQQPSSSLQSQSPLLLAALQQQQAAMVQAQKRLALEAKSGVPVYQPQLQQVSAASGMAPNLAAYYAQPQQFFAAPGAAGYIPALALGGVGGGGSAGALPPLPTQPISALPPNANNTASVAYFDESGQLLDTLPVCRDFKQAHCERPSCRYVHLLEDYVEVHEGKVTVCRDYAKGKCSRVMCKYYHVPILHPGASPLLLHNPSSLLQPSSLLLTPASSHSLFSIGPLQSV